MGLMAGTSAKRASSGIVMAVFRSASMLKTTVAEMASSGYLELTSWASSWAVSPASFLYLRSSCPVDAASMADGSLVRRPSSILRSV